MSQQNKELKPRGFDCSHERNVVSFYPSINKRGDIVAVSTQEDRKTVSYKDLRKAYFAGK